MALCNLKGRVVVNGWVYQPAEAQINMLLDETLVDSVATLLHPYARFHRCEIGTQEAHPIRVQHEGEDNLAVPDSEFFFSIETPELAHNRQDPLLASFQAFLIDQKVPLISAATSEKYLPQMINLVETGAIDFHKGCYLGQEIVARAQHRGKVKKTLHCVEWQGEVPTIGDRYEIQDSKYECILNFVTHAPNAGRALAVGAVQALQ
ncbi:MAG: hypothetical protein AAF541_02400 [Pseudomonadota bacterium]